MRAKRIAGHDSPQEAFDPLRTALEAAGVRFAIGGSWASTAFGEPRFTSKMDILGEFTSENLKRFLAELPASFYVDAEEASAAIYVGNPFNVIHMPMAFKFDFFPASAFVLGTDELDRAIYLSGTSISKEPAPFVTPEDVLLAKLAWFKSGGEVSEVQWRDVEGIARANALDRDYLRQGAARIGVSDRLARLLGGVDAFEGL